MNTLHIMDSSGDREVTWDPTNPEQVREAELMFKAVRDGGMFVHNVSPSGGGTVLHAFDPSVERMVARPRIVGG